MAVQLAPRRWLASVVTGARCWRGGVVAWCAAGHQLLLAMALALAVGVGWPPAAAGTGTGTGTGAGVGVGAGHQLLLAPGR